MRRNILISGILVGTLGASGLGWLAGRTVQSPAQIAANTAPPNPSLITVAVEKRQLSADVIVRGTVRYGAVQPITIIPSALKTGSDILTVAPIAGTTVTEGRSVMTISGRPVFVLRGAVPTYRDLAPGAQGVDVSQLQAGLGRLGFYAGAPTGTYDASTAAAVTRWYAAAGFTPFGPTPSQISALQAAQANVSQAQSTAFKAQAALDATKGTPLTVIQAAGAQRSAASAVRAAQAKAKADTSFGAMDVQAKTLALAAARIDAAAADRALTAARAQLDPTTGLSPFTPEQQAVLQADVSQAQRALGLAQSDLLAAQQSLVATRQADAGAITSAVTAVQQAQAVYTADAPPLAADQQTCSLVPAQRNQVASDQSAYNSKPTASNKAALDASQALLATEQQACARVPGEQRQLAQDSSAIQQAQAGLSAAQASDAKDAAAGAADINAKTVAVANANDTVITAQRHLTAAGQGLNPSTGLPWLSPGTIATLTDKATAASTAAQLAAIDLARAAETATSTQLDDARAISDAQNALVTSDAELNQAQSPITTSLAQQRSQLAAGDLQRALSALGALSNAAGVTVPADEILFLSALPLRVDSVKLVAGDTISGEVMRVSTAHLAVDSALSLGDATLVRVGAPAIIEETTLGITVPGTVTKVAAAPGTHGVDAQHIYLEVTPARAPAQLVGASVKLTIAVKSTNGKVLVVPASALSVASDGTSRVQVVHHGTSSFIPVVPGLGAQGLVQVRPVGGNLTAGDRVVVGLAGSSTAGLPATSSSSGAPPASPGPSPTVPAPTPPATAPTTMPSVKRSGG